MEGEQDDDPDEDFGCGADCYAVGDDPANVISVSFRFLLLMDGLMWISFGWIMRDDDFHLPRRPQPKRTLLIRHFGKVRDQVQAGYDHEDCPAD